MEPTVLTQIPEKEQEEVLATQWLKPLKKYSKGEVFGERSLKQDNDKRAGSAVAMGPVVMQTLNKEDYLKFIHRVDQDKQLGINAFLKELPFFSHWSSKFLNKLRYYLEEIHLIRNQKIYSEGDHASHVYLIREGEFLLTKTVPVKQEHEVPMEKLIGPNQASLQISPSLGDMKVVNSALGDMGPKSAAQVNPDPSKSGQ